MAPLSARLRRPAGHPGRWPPDHRALRFSFGCAREGTGDVDAARPYRSGPGGPRPPGAWRADREQVIEVLKTAFVQGRLTRDEFGTRIGRALMSQAHAELARVTADLPAGPVGARPPRQPARNAAPPAGERGPVGRRVRDARGARGHDGRGRQPQCDSGDQRGRDHRDLGGAGIRGPDGRVVAGQSTLTGGEQRRSPRTRTASGKTRLPAGASVARGLPKRSDRPVLYRCTELPKGARPTPGKAAAECLGGVVFSHGM